jgi:predicted nucleic acid-binding protein
VKTVLARHSVIALDTSIWIYHFENHPDYLPVTTEILNAVEQGALRAVASELTILEIIVRPLKLELYDAADDYEILLSEFPNLALLPVTRSILRHAATLRASYGLRTPDAIIVATALAGNATLLVTNDKALKKLKEIEVFCLEDLMGV